MVHLLELGGLPPHLEVPYEITPLCFPYFSLFPTVPVSRDVRQLGGWGTSSSCSLGATRQMVVRTVNDVMLLIYLVPYYYHI